MSTAPVVEGWDHSEKRNKEAASGRYVSLKNDGDNAFGLFVGQPVTKELFWDEKKEKYEDFDPAVHGKDARTTPNYEINFFELGAMGKRHDKPMMKILPLNNTSWTTLLSNKGKYGLDGIVYEVKRSGAKGEKWIAHIMPEGPNTDYKFTDSVKAALAEAKLHDLKAPREEETAASSSNGATQNGASGGSDPIIDRTACDAIIERIKPLGPEKVKEFTTWALAKFGTNKVKEFKASQAKDAMAWIAEREPKKEAPAAQAGNPWD